MADVRILLIRFSSLGDIVATTSLIRNLFFHWQGTCEIHYLTFSQFAPVLEHNPYVAKIWRWTRNARGENWKLLESLAQIPWTLVIDLHGKLRSRLIHAYLRFRGVSSFWWIPAFRQSIARRVLVWTRGRWVPRIYPLEYRYHLPAMRTLGVPLASSGYDLFLTDDEWKNIQGIVGQKWWHKYILVAPEGRAWTRSFPEELLDILLETITSLFSDLPVVVVGTGSAGRRYAKVLSRYSRKFPVWNMLGRTSLREFLAWTGSAGLVIGVDSAIMHIASAFHRPMLIFWGSTSPRFGMIPPVRDFPRQGKEVLHLVNDELTCHPCSVHGRASCPRQHFLCMYAHLRRDLQQILTNLCLQNMEELS